MTVALLTPIETWYCPNCRLSDRVKGFHANRFHNCPSLHGLTAPLLREGTQAKVEARDREDYVGDEMVQTDSTGRPVMSVVTTRDNGQDTIVFAPTARASLKGN